MPWNFHVTRRMFPGETERLISLAEWIALVEADVSMSLVPSGYERAYVEQMSAGLWHGHPDGAPVIFEWLAGTVTIERPDADALAKLHGLADVLGAHVEDDDGGWYDRRGHFLGHLAAG